MKKTVTLKDIIAVADATYPDGLVGLWHSHPSGAHGDTLAKFIEVELRETYDPGESNADKYWYAYTSMDTAINELIAVREAFEAAALAEERKK